MRKPDNPLERRLAAITAARPVVCTQISSQKAGPKNGRASDRIPAYKFARLLTADRSELNCIVRDVSANGVRVVLEGNVALSERVILKIDLTGERRRARVAWQREREAGLSFAVEKPFEFRRR